jgi:hypothetical protein
VLDTTSGEISEVKVPTRGSFVQWMVPDDQGRIWFAEQRGSSLGSITIVVSPNAGAAETQTTSTEYSRETLGTGQQETTGDIIGRASQQIPDLGFGFADIFGPLITGGMIVCAVLYSWNVLEVKRKVREIRR